MTDNLLTLTKTAFAKARGSVVEAMQYLWLVKEEEAWKEVSPTWSDYVSSELDISQGFASRLLGNNQHYLIEGGMTPEDLVGIDHEKLSMARNLPGTPEEQVAKARTLTRRELKEEKNDAEATPHEHEPISICKVCSLRL